MLSFTFLLSLVLCKVIKQGGIKVGGVVRCQRALCDITSRRFLGLCVCACALQRTLRAERSKLGKWMMKHKGKFL